MALEFPTRPRLIDRLRLFEVFRRHFGEEDAREVADALQDEFAPMASHDDIENLKHWVRSEINAALIKNMLWTAAVGSLLLAIAKFT